MTHIDGERMKRLQALVAEEEEPAPTKALSMREKLELALASAEKSVSAQIRSEGDAATALAESQAHKGVGGETLRELLERAAKGSFKPNSPIGGVGMSKTNFSVSVELEKLKKIKELAEEAQEKERAAAIAAYNEAVKEDLIKQSEPEPERPDSFGTWA